MKTENLEKELDIFHIKNAKLGVVLFGIKYATELDSCGNVGALVENVFSKKTKKNGDPYSRDSYKSEVKIGRDLAEYVKLIKEI